MSIVLAAHIWDDGNAFAFLSMLASISFFFLQAHQCAVTVILYHYDVSESISNWFLICYVLLSMSGVEGS